MDTQNTREFEELARNGVIQALKKAFMKEVERYADDYRYRVVHHDLEIVGFEKLEIRLVRERWHEPCELEGFWKEVKAIFDEESLDWDGFLTQFALEKRNQLDGDPFNSSILVLWVTNKM